VFSLEERHRLKSELLGSVPLDRRITGAAITGSAAIGREDRWSDIDLAFGVTNVADLTGVVSDWTAVMYERYRAVHHVDVRSGSWLYRVFLLPNTLQVDLAFAPATEFRALSPKFRLISGEAAESKHVPPPLPAEIIGLGWLHALHARTCIARQKLWQAEYMVSGARDHALALACLRHDLPVEHGRGIDMLPNKVARQFEGSLVRQLEVQELSRALSVVINGLLNEIEIADSELAGRLRVVLISLTETTP